MTFFNIFYHFILFNLMLILFNPLCGMEENKKNITTIYKGPVGKKSKNTANNDYFLKKLLTKIQESYNENTEDPSKNSIFVNANILCYNPLAKNLLKAYENKVNIMVLLDKKSLNYIKDEKTKDILKKLPTRIYGNTTSNNENVSANHAKLFLYNINNEKGFSIGSSNISSYGLFHNSEVTLFYENNSEENYKHLLQNLQKIQSKSIEYNENFNINKKTNFSPLKRGKGGLKDTPEKKTTIYSTLDKDFNALILDRLIAEKFASGDEIWLSTYTFNSSEITNALSKLLEMGVKVYIYIDKNPLTTGEGSKQIKKLIEQDALVYTYLLVGKQSYIHHAKFLLIKRSQIKDTTTKKITIISTQNFLNSQAFDVLSINQEEEIFNTMQKDVIEVYNADKNFQKITENNFDQIVILAKEKSSKKRSAREFYSSNDTDLEGSQQNKKIKN